MLPCALWAVLRAGAACASGEAPEWLRDAAAQETPAAGSELPAIVLLRERTVEVKEAGKTLVHERGAIRVLTNAGRASARCGTVYLTEGGKVTSMRGWLLGPGGSARPYGPKDCVDVRLDPNDVYSEARYRLLSAGEDAAPGAVFGWEWTSEERSVFQQFDWAFQDELPALRSRVTVRVPEGWHAGGIVMNHEPFAPVVSGRATTWELTDLPGVRDEPGAPPLSEQVPRVAIGFGPDALDHPAAATDFTSWGQVADWLAGLSEPRAARDDRLRARASELIAGRSSDLERIREIGAWVQSLNYISIQTGVGRGGGYRPRPAALVMEKGYGDCKDKANLVRALLAAVDIPAWLVAVYAGDPTYVRAEWPSPQQFNHCIVAIRLPREDSLAARVDHPELGPLLLFDPTDPWTPLGSLPESQQGGLALVQRTGEDGLFRLPVASADLNGMRRRVQVRMGPGGHIAASIRESSTGAAAVRERAWRQSASEADYRRLIEGWVGRSVAGARVQRLETNDDPVTGRFELDVAFTAERYVRSLAAGLYAVGPALVSRRDRFDFSGDVRTRPIVLESEWSEEEVTIAVPDAVRVEEFPEAAALETDFASYRTTYGFESGQVRFTRTLKIRRVTLPAGRHADVQAFFRSVRRAETALVLLREGD